MEYQTIMNLIGNVTKSCFEFKARKWVNINYKTCSIYN